MLEIANKVNFNLVRYSNCWEDADILNEGLQIKKEDVCLSIGSSGDNALSLLINSPKKVVVVDLNPTQLACIELRMAAFRNLNYDEILQFLGVKDCTDRISIFNSIKGDLSTEARDYWESNLDSIKIGFIHIGKAEKFFSLMRKFLPLVHLDAEARIKNLLEKKDLKSQKTFYYDEWNSERWRFFIKNLYSNKIGGNIARDPQFYKYVADDMGETILNRMEYALTEMSLYNNPYMHYILKGNYADEALPLYLRKENFLKIRNNLDKIELFKGDVTAALNSFQQYEFDVFNLSDIFEYMSEDEFKDNLSKIYDRASDGARIAYWNAFVDRPMPSDIPLTVDEVACDSLLKKDKAFFYKKFIVGQKL